MEIIFSDSDLAVVIKPVGLDSESAVPAAIVAQLGGECFPVHRLDLNVGGVMVYARTKRAASILSRAVQEGRMVKEYVARVHGVPDEKGDWTDLLFKDARKNKVFVVKRARAGVKEARLEYTRLATDGETSLVRIRLHTGRSHQIRVQFASRGFPLLGDHKYGARDGLSAPQLFSCALSFTWQSAPLCFIRMPDWAKDASADNFDPNESLNATYRAASDATATLLDTLARDPAAADPSPLLDALGRHQSTSADLTRLMRYLASGTIRFRPGAIRLRQNADGELADLPKDAFGKLRQQNKAVREALQRTLDDLHTDASQPDPQRTALMEAIQRTLGGKPASKPEEQNDDSKAD